MMYPSNFWNFLTFCMCSNQSEHQKSTNQVNDGQTDGKIKLPIESVWMNF